MNWTACIPLPTDPKERELLIQPLLGLPFIERLIRTLRKEGTTVVVAFDKEPHEEMSKIKAIVEKAGGTLESRESLEGRLQREEIRTVSPLERFPMKTDPDRKETEKKLLRSLIKPTEGFMSKHFERKISLAITRRIISTSITPNQMSLISIGIGLIGGLGFASTERVWHIVGSLLFLVHSITDGCDGEIARLKFQHSKLGAWLDFWGDNAVHAMVFSCMAIGLYRGGMSLWILTIGGLAVAGTLLSASLIFTQTILPQGAFTKATGDRQTEDKKAKAFSKIADSLGNRDFIYLVIFLAMLGKLHWFLPLVAVGSPLYGIMLIYIYLKSRRK
ncbi:MAG: CDP-alcohol phosphatidyltransferase family protein [Deltaproteobacteria bacterium]|nr:CDP-alcohol phosphatidyltransferase family protein [Deltaproteobacteria bacterium]